MAKTKKKATKAKAKPKKKTASKPRKAAKKAAPKKALKSKKKKSKAVKSEAPRPGIAAPPNSTLLGLVDDFYAKIGVVTLVLQASLSVGDRIQILGHTTRIEQTVASMQIEHQPVTAAKAKDGIGIKVQDRARRGDHVYLLA